MNNVTLIGRTTKDADLRYTPNGKAVATFTLAVNRTYTGADGQRETDFLNCQIWGKPAENFANMVKKGHQVGIDGRIQTRNYENQQGQRVYVTEIVVNNFYLLEKRQGNQQGQQNSYQNNYQNNYRQPYQATQNINNDPFENNGTSVDISDEDLPF